MVETPIYMDNHSTTRVDPRVIEAMLPCFSQQYGNAGSTSHPFGWDALAAVDAAREAIARAIGADPREIVFTSGATESNNLAIRGIADGSRRRGDHVVSVATEHKAILDPLTRLDRRGFEVELLDVAGWDQPVPGLLDPARVAEALRDDTALVSVMLANNEIGVLQPLAEIAAICQARGVVLHCDATQAVGRIPVDVKQLGVDLMSFSAHKLYGPKGVGALYTRRGAPRLRLIPQIEGGGQERGLRSGTLNVPGIVGFGRAVELAEDEREAEAVRLADLRRQLFDVVTADLDEVSLNGPPLDLPDVRLAGNLNCSFAGVDGEALMMSMRDLAVSSGSACTSANPEPSHVLRALGVSAELSRASLRFGLGRFNTQAEVDVAAGLLIETVRRLRQMG